MRADEKKWLATTASSMLDCGLLSALKKNCGMFAGERHRAPLEAAHSLAQGHCQSELVGTPRSSISL
jgi:hypothetical protein